MAQTGVGLTLAPHAPSGALKVTALDPEGPAARGGLIQAGDVLFDVDDTSVIGLGGIQVRTLIVGAPGSPVTLGFRRNNGKLFYVRVQRAQPKGGAAPAQQKQPAAQAQAQPKAQAPARAPAPVPQRAPAQPDDGSVVGIGVGLALDSNHNLCISSLLPGSPAKRSGLLEEGDILRYIDGKDVRGLVPEDVRPLILGRPGTYVTLSVQRGNTQIVARMARAKPTAEAAAPRAGSTTAPKADANTFSSAYAQATANKQEVQQNNVQQQQQAPAPEPPKARQAPQPNNSSLPRPAPSAATKEEEPELCGIGIVLSQNGQGELLVLSMNEGGPAARSNLIKKNDVLYTIDSTDVYKKTIEQVRPLILGLPGSTVVIGFQRAGMRNNRPVNVRLRRGTVKQDLKNIPNPSPRPSPSVTPGGGATPKQSPSHTPVSTRPSSPRLDAQRRRESNEAPTNARRPVAAAPVASRPALSREEQNEENKYGPDGPVCGLGVVLVPTPGESLCVASITEGGPAARSGRVLRGDFVETIDGVSVKAMSINDVRPLILGRAGTSVTLGLRRESEDSVVYVRVMREPVRLGEVLVPGMRNIPEENNNSSSAQQQQQQLLQQQQQMQQQQQQQMQAQKEQQMQREKEQRERVAQAQREQQAQREREQQQRQQQDQGVLPDNMQTIQNSNPNHPRVKAAQQAQADRQAAAAAAKPAGGAAPRMCGVGVVLVQVSGGAVCVKSVNKGGAAYKSGQITRGDVLYAIDGQKVLGWDVERVKPLILGHEGTPIVMTFQRVGNLVHGKRGFDVQMTRCVIEDANARMPAPRAFETASRA